MPLFWRPFRGFFWVDHPRLPGNQQPGKTGAGENGNTSCDTIGNAVDNGTVHLELEPTQDDCTKDGIALEAVINTGHNVVATDDERNKHIEGPVQEKFAVEKPALENKTGEADKKDSADIYVAIPADCDSDTSGKTTGSGVVQRPENKESFPEDKFHMVGPGMYQFSRDFMNSSPGPGFAKGGDSVSYPGAALPTSLKHYIKIYNTRDGMPVYTVK
ncbi:MAG: hypothetical protein WCY82_04330 [Desulfotomaculaceae bacterium]